ncbi:DNA repair protein rhp54 [Smittium culicis]|uniref:DNA repair protein rhp54 n=2 Tax=Smittium culicis TaxID=133412 RepID=A0A1R1YNZ3_9FUNG|nr:DNA repair protein rhp54 [Smittium culicis]
MLKTQGSQPDSGSLPFKTIPANKPFKSPMMLKAQNSNSAQTFKPRTCKPVLKYPPQIKKLQPVCLGIKRPRIEDSETTNDSENKDDSSSAELTITKSIPAAGVPKKLFSAFRSPMRIMNSDNNNPDSANPADQSQQIQNIYKSGGVKLGIRRVIQQNTGPRHDPDAEDAIVLYRPEEDKTYLESLDHQEPQKKTLASILDKNSGKADKKRVAVVVDPLLGRKLRPHQIEGVKFLYDCVTGRKVEGAQGCIMADEMGLGKTLQCIALLWTLIKQSYEPGKPTIDKCIIVCPSSLVKNWESELIKWLGSIRITPYACDNKGTKDKVEKELKNFVVSKGRMNMKPVLIISYETLRMYTPILSKGNYGLLLADEGHRLKNGSSQTFIALTSLPVKRRVILTGTPVQNDLTEYFSLLNFANPGLLGETSEFRKNFEIPILRGRDSEATDKEKNISDQKLAELASIANKVIIRRTNDLLSKYLPIKYEHVIFCPLSDLQTDLYDTYLKGKSVRKILNDEKGGGAQGGDTSLQAITILKKLCNHPGLLKLPQDIEKSEKVIPDEYYEASLKNETNTNKRRSTIPNYGGGRSAPFHSKWSGKMSLLDRMLTKLSKSPEKDKIVLISNYTQTLDLFEELCKTRGFGYLRLDGSLSIPKRMQLVDMFNNPNGSHMVFLLSSKAGGCGINLVGANRLVLFDPDWNPASDQQALARVWRDGQKKTCFIYRFISTGSIEEKIFQRQSHKLSISSCVVDERESVERHFSREQMKELFKSKLRGLTECETHESYKCKRCVNGRQFMRAPEPMEYGDAGTWDHFSRADISKAHDMLLKSCAGDDISYIFQYKSH